MDAKYNFALTFHANLNISIERIRLILKNPQVHIRILSINSVKHDYTKVDFERFHFEYYFYHECFYGFIQSNSPVYRKDQIFQQVNITMIKPLEFGIKLLVIFLPITVTNETIHMYKFICDDY